MMKKFRIKFLNAGGKEDIFVTEAQSKEEAIENMRTSYIGDIGEIFRKAEIISVEER